jgi:hypothetical protein
VGGKGAKVSETNGNVEIAQGIADGMPYVKAKDIKIQPCPC